MPFWTLFCSRTAGPGWHVRLWATTGMIMVMGEMSTDCYVDIPSIVRKTVRDIGYTDASYGFDYKTCSVLTAIDEQSSDIAMGVDSALEHRADSSDPFDTVGAGDQGMVFAMPAEKLLSLCRHR